MAVLQMKRINICALKKTANRYWSCCSGAVRLKWIRFCPRTVCFPALILPPTVLFFKNITAAASALEILGQYAPEKNPCSPR